MADCSALIEDRFRTPEAAVTYLLQYFTGADLVGIRDDLKRMEKSGVRPSQTT